MIPDATSLFTDFIGLLITFLGVGLFCCLNGRYRFYLLTYKFCWSRPLLLFEENKQILFASLPVLSKLAFSAA